MTPSCELKNLVQSKSFSVNGVRVFCNPTHERYSELSGLFFSDWKKALAFNSALREFCVLPETIISIPLFKKLHRCIVNALEAGFVEHARYLSLLLLNRFRGYDFSINSVQYLSFLSELLSTIAVYLPCSTPCSEYGASNKLLIGMSNTASLDYLMRRFIETPWTVEQLFKWRVSVAGGLAFFYDSSTSSYKEAPFFDQWVEETGQLSGLLYYANKEYWQASIVAADISQYALYPIENSFAIKIVVAAKVWLKYFFCGAQRVCGRLARRKKLSNEEAWNLQVSKSMLSEYDYCLQLGD